MNNRKYSLGIGFTAKCNMKCVFCYSKEKRVSSKDLPLIEWKNFFDTNAKYIKDVNYGTGENTQSEEWYELISYVRNNYPDIKQALTTNGSLFEMISKDDSKRKIVIESIDEVDISLDFAEKEKHNYFRGNQNAYDYAIKTLEFCNENKIKSTIVFIGLDETLEISNVKRLFSIAKENNALLRLNLFRPTSKKIKLEAPKFERIIEFFDWVNENHEIASLSDPLFSTILTDDYGKEDPSGKTSLRITQEGNIYPSTYLLNPEYLLGNIKNIQSLDEVNSSPIIKKLTENVLPKECVGCEKSTMCNGGTIDRRILWFNTLQKRDPYCPLNYGLSTTLRKFKINEEDFSSIHDGYLPTLFFKAL